MKMMSIGKNGKSNLDKVPECQCLKISLQSGEASQPTLRRGWGWGGEPTSSLNQSSLDKSQLNFSDHSYQCNKTYVCESLVQNNYRQTHFINWFARPVWQGAQGWWPPLGAPLEHPSFPTYCEMTLFGL